MPNLIPGLPSDVASECLIRIPFQSFSSAISACKDWKCQIESSEYVHRRIVSGYSQPNHGDDTSLGWLAVVGMNLAVIGGWEPQNLKVSDGVYIYNFVSATWYRGADKPEGRSFFGCASDLDRRVYVVGGHDKEKNALRSALAYDMAKNEWVQLAGMAVERDECQAFFQHGEHHVISGYPTDAQGHFTPSFEAFDPTTWTWGPLQEDFTERIGCAKTCVAAEDGRFYGSRDGEVVVLGKEGEWGKAMDLP